jgi:plastocyanin
MRRSVFVLVAVLALALAACSSDGGGDDATGATGDGCVDLTGEGAVFTITIADFAFDPSCFTASAAQGITVVNQDDVDHTFTMTGTPIDATIPAGETFNGEPITGVVEPGDYDLVCTIHPAMTGEVTVVA